MSEILQSRVLLLTLALFSLGLSGCDESDNKTNANRSKEQTSRPAIAALPRDQAESRLTALLQQVSWSEKHVQRRAKVQLSGTVDLKDTLPEIEEYKLVVDPAVSSSDVAVEIFVTTIRSGTGTDGLWVEAAREFNLEEQTLSGGQKGKVRVRKIASGTAYQFIASRKYLPDAFSPVHHLWIEMTKAHGIPVTPIRDKTVISLGGVVMKNSVAEKLKSVNGTLDIKSLINNVVEGNLAMGYTNPFASSTGLNFLVTVLSTFADGRESNLLTPPVVSAFEKFQNGVPFVALTTVHMRESVRNDGSLDAFVMGHQTFRNTPELQAGYQFIPFGVVHDHPLFAIGNLSAEKLEVLNLFADYLDRPEQIEKARDFGWNQNLAEAFQPSVPMPSGQTLIKVQQLWKEKKDAGRPIAAIFLSDVSGSMAGSRIKGLKDALISGSEFISPENSIGMVLFNDEVTVVLPVKKFNLNHRASFRAAVEDIDTTGGTHMYDGVAVSLDLLLKQKANNPDLKPVLFVLTDGQTRGGLDFDSLGPVIAGLKIPVYTIGYEANLKELGRLSSLVEAASLNAGEGNVRYKIGSLLNAQM